MSEQSQGTRPIRVCHVAYTFYENDNRVLRYAETLAGQGHHVDVIALRRPGQTRRGCNGQVNVHRIQRREVNERRAAAYLLKILWFFVKAAFVLSTTHVRRRYHVVHVHNVPDFLVFVALIPRFLGARVILDIHDILPELYAGKFRASGESRIFRSLLVIERVSCRFADHVIVANHLWYEKLVARAVPAAKCTTMLNYPDLSLFVPRPSTMEADGKFIIMYPGTLNHHQGVDIAVKAFGRAMARMPGAEFHIYGEGPARPDLERLVRDGGLDGRVKIMDRVPIAEVAHLMASADLGVVPKRAEGFGNEAFSTKILEFMACGVPVVVSRTQIDEYYFDETIVRFFTSGNESHLADILAWAYAHRECHGRWIEAARNFAVRHSWQERVIDYRRVIESLVIS